MQKGLSLHAVSEQQATTFSEEAGVCQAGIAVAVDPASSGVAWSAPVLPARVTRFALLQPLTTVPCMPSCPVTSMALRWALYRVPAACIILLRVQGMQDKLHTLKSTQNEAHRLGSCLQHKVTVTRSMPHQKQQHLVTQLNSQTKSASLVTRQHCSRVIHCT